MGQQPIHDYLRHVLASSGPQAPPYAQHSKQAIHDQLVELQNVFPTLGVKQSEFHTNDGRLMHLLKADGTIPIHYQSAKYNIPVIIWITSRFPEESPLVYVMPTTTMIIKAGHKFVDRSGQVSVPAISNWNPRTHNLVALTLQMCEVFGKEPPLYSAPQGVAAAAQNTASMGVMQPPPGYPVYQSQPLLPSPTNGGRPPYASNPSYPSQPPPQLGPQYSSYPPSPSLSSPSSSSQSQSSYSGYPPPPPSLGPPSLGFGPPPGSRLNPQGPPVPDMLGATIPSPPLPLWGAIMSSVYGQPPPNSSRPDQPPAPPSQQDGRVPTLMFPEFGSRSNQSDFAASNRPPYMQSGGRPPPPPPPPRLSQADVTARFRPLAIEALRLQVDSAEAAWLQCAPSETEKALDTQRQLVEHGAQLQTVVTSLKAERQGTEGLVAEIGSKQAQLVAWLERNEPKAAAWRATMSEGQQVEWQRVAPGADALAQQTLDTQAEDMAVEDTVLALDKALQAGAAGVPLDAYLKQVRALCRRQFFARALGLKVGEAQRAQHPPPPPPSQGSQLTSGGSTQGQMPPGNGWGQSPFMPSGPGTRDNSASMLH